jgi:membrane protease subunit HflK
MTDTPAAGDQPTPAADGLGALLREGGLKLLRAPRLGRRGVRLLVAVVVIGWAATSIYRVQPDEQGVVLRFGRWIDTTQPGLHFHLPFPIDAVLFPKVTQINQVQLGNPGAPGDPASGRERQMLTGDENIVEADCAVFWKIRDAGEFLFRVNAPEAAVKIAAEGALRDVISRTPIQAAMSDKRQQIADQTKTVLQSLLDSEHAGIEITQVQLLRVEPPLAVIDAFNDVQRARADQERSRNEAEAYANDILPRARGDAERLRQDAEAYKTQVVNLAQGDANAFLAVYDSYRDAKDVTAWRLYLDSVDEMLRKASKVILDTSGKGVSSVVPYMPVTETRARPNVPQGLAPPAVLPGVAPPAVLPGVAPQPTPTQGVVR